MWKRCWSIAAVASVSLYDQQHEIGSGFELEGDHGCSIVFFLHLALAVQLCDADKRTVDPTNLSGGHYIARVAGGCIYSELGNIS
jgi:hypothetical protein